MIFDYERRIQALEARVQALEDALKKERAAQVPEAQAQEKVTAQSSPAPAVQTPEKAPEQSLAAAAETREKTPEQSPAQQTVSAQLRAALDAPADPSCFQYMPEPGTVTDFWNYQKPERALQKLVGMGLRITAYTGFDAERVVIPAKIGGQPVVSIGEKAFKNTTVSEVILPGSIKAILGGGIFRLQAPAAYRPAGWLGIFGEPLLCGQRTHGAAFSGSSENDPGGVLRRLCKPV